MSYFVYLIVNKKPKNRLTSYVGYTNNLNERIKRHNSSKGAKFTRGRFLFKSDKDILRAKKMGINDLNKKYEIDEIVRGDSIFCATGITTGDLVNGIKLENGKYITETLVTHKNSTISIVKKEIPIT